MKVCIGLAVLLAIALVTGVADIPFEYYDRWMEERKKEKPAVKRAPGTFLPLLLVIGTGATLFFICLLLMSSLSTP
ncbi:hypothetical protein HON52_04155 [Candidatus Uhrbacteria bacterium]|nr:hypothetical protein [Candidatus Uhrbacteria bacterium]